MQHVQLELALPDGWSAWAADERPVRRVANCSPGGQVTAHAAGVDPRDVSRLAIDAAVFGDAWVDFTGRRVDPADVRIVGPEP